MALSTKESVLVVHGGGETATDAFAAPACEVCSFPVETRGFGSHSSPFTSAQPESACNGGVHRTIAGSVNFVPLFRKLSVGY